MTAAARLHAAVTRPGPRDLAQAFLISEADAIELDAFLAAYCPGCETCEECERRYCDLCLIASPGCAHDHNLCAECRPCCHECRLDCRDDDEAGA